MYPNERISRTGTRCNSPDQAWTVSHSRRSPHPAHAGSLHSGAAAMSCCIASHRKDVYTLLELAGLHDTEGRV